MVAARTHTHQHKYAQQWAMWLTEQMSDDREGGEVIVRLPHCDYLSYRVMVWLIVLRGADTLSKTLSKTV